MPSPLLARRGSITAEWALALPAVMLTLWLILAALSVNLEQARLSQASADGARLAGLGASDTDVSSHISQLTTPDIRIEVQRSPESHQVCVSVWRDQAPAWRNAFPVHAHSRSCALYPGP